MLQKVKNLLLRYRGPLCYLVFGVLTTLVNYAVYLPCYNDLRLSATVSNVLAWVVAVLFAYLTNKPFVFRSRDWSAKTVVPEFLRFVGCRIASGALETGTLLLAVDVLHRNGNLWKIIVSVAVIILNYIGSKLLVFRKKKTEDSAENGGFSPTERSREQ